MSDDERRRDERVEAKAKRVVMGANFTDWIGALADAAIAARYNELTDCIVDGKLIPPSFYRRGIERTPDDLLDEDGIKHFHLDEGGGDALIFVVEYDDAVVFLEINSHKHFETEPAGSVLLSLHANCLKREDAAAAERKVERLKERIRIFRSGLKPRRSNGPSPDATAPRGKGD